MKKFLESIGFMSANKIALASASGHLLMLLSSPLLARLYSEEDFAVLGLFLTLTSVLSLIACFRWDLRLATAKDAREATNLFLLTIASTLVFLPFCVLVSYILINTNTLGFGAIPLWVLPLITLYIVLIPISMSVHFWLVRLQDYNVIAKAQFRQAATRPLTIITLGALNITSIGLMLGEMAARLIHIATCLKGNLQNFINTLKKTNKISIQKTFTTNWKHCAFAMPATSINTAAFMMTVPLITTYFGLTAAGIFMFVERITIGPLNVVSKAFSDVMQGRIVQLVQNTRFDEAMAYYFKTAFVLTALCAPCSMIAYIFAEDIFAFIFGENWRSAGTLVSIFAPLYIIWLVARALSAVQNAVKRLDLQLYFSVVYLVSGILLFRFCHDQGYSFLETMQLFVYQNGACYLFYIALQIYALYQARYRKAMDET